MLGLIERYFVLPIAVLAIISAPGRAQTVKHTDYLIASHVSKPETQLSSSLAIHHVDSLADNSAMLATSLTNNLDDLLSATNGLAESKVNQKFSRVLKSIRIIDIANQGANDKRVFTRMADLFVRLKLYPLAMKCYLKTLPVVNSKRGGEIDTISVFNAPAADDSILSNSNIINLTPGDDSVFNQKTRWLDNHVNEDRSKEISSKKINAAFEDGKPGIAYALLFHVKQPVPGRRKVFHWVNTGHTYITLIKYNSDSTCVTKSFGFYPKKDNILSATPLQPSTSAVFKDDGGHNWDEVVGKFISRHKFKRILKLVSQFSESDYQLSDNNCTDFAIGAATIAGIYIENTKSKWPLGRGNTPGATGQSIIKDQISSDDHVPLFVYKNINAGLVAQ